MFELGSWKFCNAWVYIKITLGQASISTEREREKYHIASLSDSPKMESIVRICPAGIIVPLTISSSGRRRNHSSLGSNPGAPFAHREGHGFGSTRRVSGSGQAGTGRGSAVFQSLIGLLFYKNFPEAMVCHVCMGEKIGLMPTGHPRTFELPDAPQLREAVLNKRGSSTAVTLLWMQLTSLTLSEEEPSWYFSILQQTPKLVHCNLDVWIADDEIIDQTGPDIRLPCLE
ncbi:hypothetical protein B0H14DRAFT_2619354 [Mycena olivaceomarginata]|nr:hypothetical protein B0H14DRAFT_2619354 [Mycena olivaceomarginata]